MFKFSPTHVLVNNAEADTAKRKQLFQRREPYYTVDDGVIFLVEGKFYRIPRRILLEAEYFRGILQSTASDDQEEGSKEKVVTPSGVTRIEIESLLDLLHAGALDGLPKFTIDQLSAILHLSTKWGHNKAREYAINEIDKVDQPPLERLELAFRCSVSKWLRPAYAQLCIRPESLNMEEARRLGMDKFFAISQIREKRLSRCCSGSSPCTFHGSTKGSACRCAASTACAHLTSELERLSKELDLDMKSRSLQSS